MNSDWKLDEWGFEPPEMDAVVADLHTGQPAATFVNEAAGLRLKITFQRTGDPFAVCFSGPGLSMAGLPHVAKLASDGRQVISDWVIAYEAGRSPELRRQEAQMRQLHAELGEKAQHAGIPDHLLAGSPLTDMVEGFAPPPRPGRGRNSDTFLAATAKEYVTRCVLGHEKVSTVAKDLGRSQATFSTQLKAARERGLLTGSPRRGAVEGELTPEAERLLSATAAIGGDTNGNHQAS